MRVTHLVVLLWGAEGKLPPGRAARARGYRDKGDAVPVFQTAWSWTAFLEMGLLFTMLIKTGHPVPWPLSPYNVASAPEKLNFLFYLRLI